MSTNMYNYCFGNYLRLNVLSQEEFSAWTVFEDFNLVLKVFIPASFIL